jgi:hypothetical protein
VSTLEETVRQILALPREAGTPEALRARELASSYLTGLGYTVARQSFTFAPSSLDAFPVFGAGLGGLAVLLFPFLASAGSPRWTALAIWITGLTALSIVSTGIGLGWVHLGAGLREDANLIATRTSARPRRWVVAHLDSKAQGHSMAGRLVAVWVVGFASVGLTVLVFVRLAGTVPPLIAGLGTVLALLAGVLAGRGRLRGRSHGARDNGSGIVAALAAASMPNTNLGILLTGAEEFGLVGARVFARLSGALPDAEFVNVDTIDQAGSMFLVSHDQKGERLARAWGPRLTHLGVPIRFRRLPLGIFVDSAPLARIAPAFTIGRLTWNTLRCIHTPADTAAGLSLRTAEDLGRALATN